MDKKSNYLACLSTRYRRLCASSCGVQQFDWLAMLQ